MSRASQPKTLSSPAICLVCDKLIKDNTRGQESAYCEGDGSTEFAWALPRRQWLSHPSRSTASTVPDVDYKLGKVALNHPPPLGEMLTVWNLTVITDANQRMKLPHRLKGYNVVVFGIKENPKGTPRHDRIAKDSEDVESLLHDLHPDVQKQLIRDCKFCRRKGKTQTDSGETSAYLRRLKCPQ